MKHTLHTLWKMKQEGRKITMLTCYDASFAQQMQAAEVDVLLVGDSLGTVVQGESTTLPVTLEHMLYHTRAVVRGAPSTFIVADMPFASYQTSPQAAFANAAALLAAGAHMVKLEGGEPIAATVRYLVERGIPVCGHLGFTPQSLNQLGGYKVQGRDEESAQRLLQDAQLLQEAGAGMLVLEMVPSQVAAQISRVLNIPAIGIGAGVDCDGQVLVCYDMLGIYSGKKGRFVRDFMAETGSVPAALRAYVTAVQDQSYPAPEHGY